MVDGRIQVIDVPQHQRFEVRVNGEMAGRAEYRMGDGVVEFTHTEVDSEHEGEGLGGRLAQGALDDVRSRGRFKVVPTCPFIAHWIEEHPAYQRLLAG